jgi:putative DNA primase/helicase
MLGEFPFADDTSRAHAVAFLLQAAVRELIAGQTPAYGFDAPTEGTGKGLLHDVLTLPFAPRGAATLTAPPDESEWRKLLTSVLQQGPSHVMIDNVRQVLDSPALASALTRDKWFDRIMGTSKMIDAPIRCAWAVTGNNLEVSPEMARRIVRIRLDAGCERPNERTFQIDDLRGWTLEHRAEIVAAALTLARAWVAWDRPQGDRVLGSYPRWSRVVGGILEAVGISGFLGHVGAFGGTADRASHEWRALVDTWWARHGERKVGTRELFSMVTLFGLLEGEINGRDDAARSKSFGKLLKKQVDRVYLGLQIKFTGTAQRMARYQLVVRDEKALRQWLQASATEQQSEAEGLTRDDAAAPGKHTPSNGQTYTP